MYETLTEKANDVLSETFSLSNVDLDWRRPQEAMHGDISTAIALKLSKEVGQSPRDIAEKLIEGLSSLEDVSKVELAGPGYVNVWLTPKALIAALADTREACTARVKRGGAPVIVEYSQPNIAKPLGAHHLLTTLIGQSIANLYEHQGYDVIKWNYIGDWGTQFGKLAIAVGKWGDDRKASEYSIDELLALYVRFHEEVENDLTLDDAAREAFLKLEEGDAHLQSFWEDIVRTTKADLAALYETLHVSFDLDLGESFYQDKTDAVLHEGREKHVFTEGEGGSLIVQFSEESHLPPYLVQKGDGATLYSTRDIAQMRYRIDTYHPQEILIVTDIAQKLHFEQLVETCKQLQWKIPAFENVLSGRMRFADKSMSTRKGNVLKLKDVLEEAVRRAEEKIAEHEESIQTNDLGALASMMGVGAVSYGILSQNRKQDIIFDWEKMLSFDGNSAPYLQYTHARAKSVLRKAETEHADMPADMADLMEKERVLMGTLLEFSRVLEEARASHIPHILANYLFQLCQDFNSFYNDTPILKATEPERQFRLALTHCTASVLKTGAELLTISVPDRM
ncbi:arginine--tRNA ligase [Candidatus Peregrinibacteria bacterium CG10_big_fil_rev_8_21_14_0_10_49_24]|nr:MAG: arginine--tRNA ligase [Candidatus Peregrinibacteria bacterium CG11_big_fil_rev_8_21_14_0_20_49_14]PIR51134.1 MAG: arginine--tRNA ligase [Candidatus Peregrinibacteria bacterium CG10_big_fil_rev_8_21_14_0_10_49_24]